MEGLDSVSLVCSSKGFSSHPSFHSLFKGEAKLYLEKAKEKATTQLQALSETLQDKTEQKAPALGERGR